MLPQTVRLTSLSADLLDMRSAQQHLYASTACNALPLQVLQHAAEQKLLMLPEGMLCRGLLLMLLAALKIWFCDKVVLWYAERPGQ